MIEEPGRTATVPRERQEERTRSRALDPYKVILHNDDVNSMDHVVRSLVRSVPGMSIQKAARIMLEAHNSGRAVVTVCPLELAELIRKTPGYDDPARIADSMARWSAKMEILEGALAGASTGYIGAGFSIADIALGLSVHRWMSIRAEKKEFPAVADYYERLMSREAGARWMAPETPTAMYSSGATTFPV